MQETPIVHCRIVTDKEGYQQESPYIRYSARLENITSANSKRVRELYKALQKINRNLGCVEPKSTLPL